VVFLHGGPGGGISPDYRRYFDPQVYRVVLFDQRGSARALRMRASKKTLPGTWSRTLNVCATTLVSTAGRFLAVRGAARSRWLTRKHIHQRVTELVFAGHFSLSPKRDPWFYQQGASAIFPDVWEEYLKVIPENERSDMVSAYYRRLTSDDAAVRLDAARAWSIWEGSTSKLFSTRQ
jgi:proline iminopeptidase